MPTVNFYLSSNIIIISGLRFDIFGTLCLLLLQHTKRVNIGSEHEIPLEFTWQRANSAIAQYEMFAHYLQTFRRSARFYFGIFRNLDFRFFRETFIFFVGVGIKLSLHGYIGNRRGQRLLVHVIKPKKKDRAHRYQNDRMRKPTNVNIGWVWVFSMHISL